MITAYPINFISGEGGGGGDITVTLQTINMSAQTLTGQYDEDFGGYYTSVKIADVDESIVNGIPYNELFDYHIFAKSSSEKITNGFPYKKIDDVDIYFVIDYIDGILIESMSETEFTVNIPADTFELYRATSEVVDTFGDIGLIDSK